MITSVGPTDWRDLQRHVGRILTEAGLSVEIEKTITLGRGAAEIDVYAEELVKGRRYVILAECKHWSSPVPQAIIHGFRTVVGDAGANLGYVISSAGFQSGAFTAAELTNLRLVTWDEFQQDFETIWLEHHFLPTTDQRLNALFTYTEPLVPRTFLEVEDDAVIQRLKALREEHTPFGVLMTRFTSIGLEMWHEVPRLPLRDQAPDLVGKVPATVLDSIGYREFLEAALAHADDVVQQFRSTLRAGGVQVPISTRGDEPDTGRGR
jgi:hypothetical protein